MFRCVVLFLAALPTTDEISSLLMKLGGSGLLSNYFPKKTRQTTVTGGAGFDLSSLLAKLKAETAGTWDRASLCAMVTAPAPTATKTKRQDTTMTPTMATTSSFVADFCAKVSAVFCFLFLFLSTKQ